MTINEADVEAARRILADHETRFADVPMLHPKASPAPTDHPDWADTNDDPDADMAYIHAMYQALDWFREHVRVTVDYGRDIYDGMREKFNNIGEWTPLAALIRDISIMETIGLNIQEDW